MLRTAFLCCVASSLVTACVAEDVPDELAGEGDDGEGGKADGTGTFTYFQIATDPSAHAGIEADVAGFLASRPNRATTTCGDAAAQPSCYARSIDWSATGLAAQVATEYEERLRGGEPILLRGAFEPESAAARDHRISQLASARLAGTFATELAASQPMIDVGGGPDCLYAQLDVKSVTVTSAKTTVTTAASGAPQITGSFDGVSITASAKFAVSCVDGTAPITIRIARVDISPASPVTVTGLVIEGNAQLPQPVDQMLALRDRAADLVARTAQVLVQPIVAAEAGPAFQLAATEVWVPGHAANDDEDLDNVFVFAKNEDTKIREARLNSTRSARINSIDFAAAHGTADAVAAAQAALGTEGVILSGPRVTRQGKVARSAERFWLRAAATE